MKDSSSIYLMSNLVVWFLLSELILRTLDEIGESTLTTEVERLRENHPLVLYVEKQFQTLLKPNGGLSCPELEKELRELRKRDPIRFEQLVKKFVKDYYKYYWKKKQHEISYSEARLYVYS